jgi:hypothetical protein
MTAPAAMQHADAWTVFAPAARLLAEVRARDDGIAELAVGGNKAGPHAL